MEGEIAELELSFQNPATGTDWETTHKRYADLKLALERLYEDLASRWELMGLVSFLIMSRSTTISIECCWRPTMKKSSD